jgi:hypothetical protein
MICLLILMKGLKDGLLRERQFKNVEKIFRRYIPVLNQILMPEEKVRFYTLARRLPDAMEAVLTHGVMSIHMGLIVITTQRALFLATDLFAHQLRQIHEASLSEFRETRKDPPKKLFGRFGNPAGAGTLTLYFTADSPPIRFQFFWSRLVEEAVAAIEEGRSHSRSSFQGFREICLNCYTPLFPSQIVCPKCRNAARPRWNPAFLSLTYPGLGQLANRSLLKGVFFLTVFTLALLQVVVQLLFLYRGTTEVSPSTVVQSAVLALLLWIGSAADAHYGSK